MRNKVTYSFFNELLRSPLLGVVDIIDPCLSQKSKKKKKNPSYFEFEDLNF